jgi:WD40 repeat protein
MLSVDWGAVTAAAPLLTAAREAADDRAWLCLRNDPSVNRNVLLAVLQHGATVWGIAWSPCGDLLASAGSDGVVRIWDARTGNSLARVSAEAGQANAVAWSADGAELASGHDDGTVRIWDAETMAERAALQVAPGGVLSLAWSPEGDRLAVGAARGQVIVVEGGQRRVCHAGEHAGEVYTLAWSPDGSVLASGGSDALVRLWERQAGFALRATLEDRALLTRISGILPGDSASGAARHLAAVLALAWSPDGLILASGSRSGFLRLWDPISGTPGDLIPLLGAGIWSLAWSPDGLLASGLGEGQIILGDPARRQQAQLPMGHADAVRGLGFGPDACVLASCGDDGTVRLWEARALWDRAPSMVDPAQQGGHTAGISRVAWSGDGLLLVAGDRNCSACYWDAETGRCLARVEELGGPVLAMSSAGRGVLLAASLSPGETPVTCWEGPEAEPTTRVTVQGAVTALALSPDGRILASGDHAGTVWLTRMDDRTTCGVFLIESALGTRPEGLVPVWGLAWSPDGRFVAAAGRMGLIVWNAHSGTQAQVVLRPPELASEDQEFAAMTGFGDAAAALCIEDHPVAWSPDGTILASSSAERAIRLWKPVTGEPVAVLEGHKRGVTALEWSRDGTLLASAGNDATVRVWDVRTGRRVALAHCLSSVMSVRFPDESRVVRAADDGAATGLRPIPYVFELRRGDPGDAIHRQGPARRTH